MQKNLENDYTVEYNYSVKDMMCHNKQSAYQKGDVLCVILPSHPKRKDMLKK